MSLLNYSRQRSTLRRFTSACALVIVSAGIVSCSDSPSETEVPDPQQVAVIVRFEGDGAGRVHTPNATVGIDCSTTESPANKCFSAFPSVGTFQLHATPNTGSAFALWACSATHAAPVANCGACTGAGGCELSTACCGDVTLTVIARFEPVAQSSIEPRGSTVGAVASER